MMYKLIAVGAALLIASVAQARPAPGAPRLYVADFSQDGYEGEAGQHVADLLARALAETGRFEVERIADTPAALERARAGRTGPAWLVEGGILGLRAVGPNSVGLTGIGYGRGVYGLSRRVLNGTPGNLARGSSFAVDGWVRVHDANDGRKLGQKRFQGWTIGMHPNYWDAGPAAQVLDASVLDEKYGAARTVLDLLPLEGHIVAASSGGTARVDVGSARTVAQGERFVVVPAEGGDPVAILRARHAVSAREIEAGVSYPEHGGRAPRAGDQVLSRGW